MTDTEHKKKRNTSHTPGPWKINPRRNAAGNFGISTAGQPIACVYNGTDWGYDAPERLAAQANAHLIAAAPKLLEAHEPDASPSGPDFLDWIADRLIHVYGENPNVDFVLALRRKAHKARAAIAEATGKEAA
jgi:hypothetical protein